MAKLKELRDPKYVIDFVDICAEIDPSDTHKYVPFILKLIEEYINQVKKDYHSDTFKDIKELIADFHELSERNQIQNKDIYSYESFEELENIVKEGKSKITESQIKQRETTILYDDDDCLVVRPLSVRSSRLYGSSTKWCTSSERDDYTQHFNRYAGMGVLVYYINKKKDPLKNKYAKVAFHNETDFKEKHNITLWDVEDHQLNNSEMFLVVGPEIPLNIYQIIQQELMHGKKIDLIKI
jgi:hypothetical protein